MTEWNRYGAQPQGMAGPGPVRLGPMTLADIIDSAFKIIGKNWKPFLLASAVFVAPMAVISLLAMAVVDVSETNNFSTIFDPSASDETSLRTLVGLFAVSGIQGVYAIIAFPLLIAAITRVAAATYLGRSLSMDVAARQVVKLWPSMLAASILTLMVALVGGIFCLIPGLVSLMFALSTPVIAMEELGPIRAMKRSWKLMASRFWPHIGTLLLTVAVAFVVQFLVQIPFAIAEIVTGLFGADKISWVMGTLADAAGNLVIAPFAAVVVMLVYFDARVRREGFDLQVMAGQLQRPGYSPPPNDQGSGGTPPSGWTPPGYSGDPGSPPS